jgi:hypothetical protein
MVDFSRYDETVIIWISQEIAFLLSSSGIGASLNNKNAKFHATLNIEPGVLFLR